MKVIQAYVKGWLRVFNSKRIVGVMYLLNFVLALLSAIPIKGLLGSTVSNSLSLGRSKGGFDYTFLNEINQQYGDRISAILDQTLLFVLLFVVASVFMIGGVLHVFKKDQLNYRLGNFWRGGLKYFGRLFRLTCYFLLVHGLVFLIFFKIFSVMCDGLNPFNMRSEEQMIHAGMILLPIYLIFFTLIALIQDFAKVHLVHTQPKLLFQTFWGSFKLVFKNLGKFFGLYLLNIITFFAVTGVYWLASSQTEGITNSAVLFTFILGQIFILARIAMKLLNLSSITYLYKWTREGYMR